MQVVETLSEGLKREYALTVPAADMAAKMNEKIEAVRADFQMKGFRKGKAPAALLKKMFGKNMMGEILQESVDEAMRKHFEETGDQPSQQPEIAIKNDDFDEGDDLTFELKYERLPEIPETDFAAVKLERLVAEVTDAEVDEALEKLAEQAQSFAEKEGAAEDGDQVTFDFVGTVNGEAFDGGSAEDFPLVLGSGQFIPGFEEQLVGVSAGEEKNVDVTFPEDYGVDALKGQAAVFACTVKQVAAPAKAEINDELATKFGAEDLAALKDQMRERLNQEYTAASRQVVKRKLLDALDEAVSFELPVGLVSAEADQIARALWQDENPDAEAQPEEKIEPTEEHNRLAERRVRLGLLLAEIGRKAEVEVTEGEINQAIFQQAQQYPGQEKAFFDFVRQNPQALQQVRAPIFEDKVVDYVLELAEVTDNQVSKEDLEKAIEALEE